jgi:4-hydroxybenzoate polyprenyltransferase
MNGIRNELLLLIKVSTPVSWGALPLVFLLGLTVSGNISGSITITPVLILQILMLSFPFCIFLFGINDIYDYETDRINPRKGDLKGGGFLEGIKLEPEYHSFVKHAAFLVISLLLLTSLLTLNIANIVGMLLLVFFCYFYSAPPLRFKERPPLGSFSSAMLYFFAPFLLGFSFSGSIINNFDVLVGSILLTVCVMGIDAYATIIDYGADKEVGVKTFATVFGKRSAAFFAFLTFIITIFVVRLSPLIKPVTYYSLGFCSVLFFITVVVPTRKIAKSFFSLIALGLVGGVMLTVYTNLVHF